MLSRGPSSLAPQVISDTVIENHFDSSHNTLESIRRVADIYEWGTVVLWPGIFGNAGPHCSNIGLGGGFNPALASVNATDIPEVLARKGCNDDAWPDGEGTFHGADPTGWTIDELLDKFNGMDWSEGLSIISTRVKPTDPKDCATELLGGNAMCLTELNQDCLAAEGPAKCEEEKDPFGYNWTHPEMPLENQFIYRDAKWLGTNPNGVASAAPASLRLTAGGGYVAIVLPFFSDAYIPEQRGTYRDVTGFEEHRVCRGGSENLNPDMAPAAGPVT